jgi:hypothetical protein
MINSHADEYTEEENDAIAEGLAHFARFDDEANAKAVKSISPLCQNEIAQTKNDRLAWGRSRIEMRGRPEDILSYQWDFLARHLIKPDTIEKKVVERVNEHNIVVHMVKVIPNPLADRELVMRFLWKKLSEDSFVFVIDPTSHKDYPLNEEKRVRAKFPTVVKLTRSGEDKTRVDYVLQLDVGGSDKKSVVNYYMKLYLRQQLKRTFDLHNYFQALRGLEQWDADDGRAVGEVMVIKTKGEANVGARMREMFRTHKGLSEIGGKYEFFEAMMARVVHNKLRPAGDVKTKLCNLSLKKGRTIGAGLAMCLASALTAEAAVDEWIGKYPALKELDRYEVWFRPMVNVAAKRMLSEVSWGLKMRAFVGAFLSLVDIASDVNVVVAYMASDAQAVYGRILLGMIGASLALHMMVAVSQRWGNKKELPRQILIVLLCLKPVQDAVNVVQGKDRDEHNVIDARMELNLGKAIEML